jgi:PAS domain S-box-containing protein
VDSARAQGRGERLRFQRLSVEDGLSNTWVRAVVKDSRGFLWLATPDGLNRYDGSRVVHYRHRADDPHSLVSSEVWSLFEDRRQRLWVGTAEGLDLYDPKLDRFDAHPLTPEGGSLGGDRIVRAIHDDGQGRLFVGTMRGLCRYDPQTRQLVRFLHDGQDSRSVIQDAIMSLDHDGRQRLWVGTRGGLDAYDTARGEFVHPETLLPALGALRGTSVESLYCAPDGAVWVATYGLGLWRLDPALGRSKSYRFDPADPASLRGDRVLRVNGDGRGAIFAGLENDGLDVLDVARERWTHYLFDPEDPGGVASPSIWALEVDNEGILWVGTFNGGLNYHLPLGQNFALIRARRGELSDPHVTSVTEDHLGSLWIGTDGGGLNRLDRSTGRFTYYRRNRTTPRGLSSDAVLALLEDRDRKIWIGTWAGGVMRLDPATGQMLHLDKELNLPNAPVNMGVWTIVEDRQGDVLIGTENSGVLVFERRTQKVVPLSHAHPSAGASGSVRAVVEDRDGRLWLSRATDVESRGFNFVQCLDRITGSVVEFHHEPGDPNSLAPGAILAIHADSRGNVWIGTTGGLTVIPHGRARIRRFGAKEGLPSDVITSILEDESANLWIGTTHGLARLRQAVQLPERFEVNVYDEHDGLQGNEFKNGAAFRSRSGEMFFGGQRGLSSFFPGRIGENTAPPPVVLTDLRVFNRSARIGAPGSPLKAAIWATDSLTLGPDQTVLTFEFAALNYTLSRKNRYAYQLEGLEPQWNEAGTQNTATYTSLPHGHYVFRVRAANNDGVWNEKGVALQLEVTPRWHERPLVRVAVLLALGLLGVIAVVRREGLARGREQELARRVAERTVELHRLNEELEARVSSRTSELVAEKERLAVTLRSIGDAVIATDIDGRIALMNRVAEDLTGWAAVEADGRPLQEVMPLIERETREALPDPAGTVLGGGRVLNLPDQSVLVRRDGREILIADSVAPIRDQESRVVGVVVVFRDVTERRRIEAQLQNAEKLESLGILAGGIAHDFNNLLTGVFGFIDLARRRADDGPKARDILGKALSVLDRARGLTGQLLTFSRSEVPLTTPLALGALIPRCVDFALSGSNVNCEMDLRADLWPCRGDERQIDQVIDNLLLNGRQAMPQGGTITVTADNITVPDDAAIPLEEGRYVRIRIRDQGPGIRAELRSRIFEPFFTTKAEGTGLGLATSYSIVSKHGGYIDVDSEAGRGTTFIVYLPASMEPVRGQAEVPEEPPRGSGRILVLDDEDYVRDVAQEILEGQGYVVECAASGEEAVRLWQAAHASSRPFSLLILDLTIPGGLGGVGVLQRLREIQPGVVAVASSGYSGDTVMTDPAAHGFADRLAKPYTAGEMGKVVARLLGNPAAEGQSTVTKPGE